MAENKVQLFGRKSKLLSLFGFLSNVPDAYKPNTGSKTMSGGSGAYASNWNFYKNTMMISYQLEDQIKDYTEMLENNIIHSACALYAEECTQTDILSPSSMWIESSEDDTRKELDELLARLNVEDILYSQVFNLAAYGNVFEKLNTNREQGIVSTFFVPPDMMRRHWDENRNLLGFTWTEKSPDVDVVKIKTGDTKEQTVWSPWSFIQFRILGRRRDTEYGEGMIEPARSVYKQYKMALDAMTVHRLDIMPSRIVVKIDTGVSDPFDQAQILEEYKMMIRNQTYVSQQDKSMISRRDPFALDSVIFFPFNKDRTHTIEKFAGDSDVPDIPDIELLLNLMFCSLRIPKAYAGFEGDINSKASLIQQDIRFARLIKTLRRYIIAGWTRMCQIHLALKNKNPYADFKIKMAPISAVDEEIRIEILQKQVDIIDSLMTVGDSMNFNKVDWGTFVLKEYLHLPNDLVDGLMMNIDLVTTQPTESKNPTKSRILPVSNGRKNVLEAIDKAVHGNPVLQRNILELRKMLKTGMPDEVHVRPNARKEELPIGKN